MNELNIIALIGASGVGKTTILNLVYNQLLNGQTSSTREPLGSNPNDFSDIIIWNDLKIAIFTMGDFSGRIIRAMNWANENNCEYLVIAINDRFVRPFRELQNFENTQIRISSVGLRKERQAANELIVNQIIDLLR